MSIRGDTDNQRRRRERSEGASSWVWAPAAVRPPECWGLKFLKREGEKEAQERRDNEEEEWLKNNTNRGKESS